MRHGYPQQDLFIVQSNLANTYQALRRLEPALRMRRDIYAGNLKFKGEENYNTLQAALNYASTLCELGRFEETKSLLRKIMPVAPHVLGESHETTLRMRWTYAAALYNNTGATLDDLREAATTLEDIERIARRVLGGAHPLTVGIGEALRAVRAALRRRETPGSA